MTPQEAKRKHLKSLIGIFYNGVAPKETTSPYLIAVELGAVGQRNGMGKTGAYEFEPRIYAEAVGETFPSSLADTLSALDQATTQQEEWQVFSHLIDPYEDSFSDDKTGLQYRREGGDYRVLVRPIPAPQEP